MIEKIHLQVRDIDYSVKNYDISFKYNSLFHCHNLKCHVQNLPSRSFHILQVQVPKQCVLNFDIDYFDRGYLVRSPSEMHIEEIDGTIIIFALTNR